MQGQIASITDDPVVFLSDVFLVNSFFLFITRKIQFSHMMCLHVPRKLFTAGTVVLTSQLEQPQRLGIEDMSDASDFMALLGRRVSKEDSTIVSADIIALIEDEDRRSRHIFSAKRSPLSRSNDLLDTHHRTIDRYTSVSMPV